MKKLVNAFLVLTVAFGFSACGPEFCQCVDVEPKQKKLEDACKKKFPDMFDMDKRKKYKDEINDCYKKQ